MRLIALLLLAPLFGVAQISDPVKDTPEYKVGKVSPGIFIAELTYKVEDNDTLYTIRYKNYKYQHIEKRDYISFSGVDSTVGKLYNIFMSVFKDENKDNKDYAVTFQLGQEMVSISAFKYFGTSARFFTTTGYFYLTKGQVDKLFGK